MLTLLLALQPARAEMAATGDWRRLQDGSASCAGSERCGPGTFDAAPDDPTSPCEPCPAGRFSEDTGAILCAGECQDGSYSHAGSTSNATCEPCGPGTYDHDADAGTPCEQCVGGKFSSATGAVVCAGECQAGSDSPPGAVSESACEPCEAGRYNDDSDGSTACVPCPARTFAPAPGAVVCDECDDGYNDQPGQAECSTCPAGTIVLPSADAVNIVDYDWTCWNAADSSSCVDDEDGLLASAFFGCDDFIGLGCSFDLHDANPAAGWITMESNYHPPEGTLVSTLCPTSCNPACAEGCAGEPAEFAWVEVAASARIIADEDWTHSL